MKKPEHPIGVCSAHPAVKFSAVQLPLQVFGDLLAVEAPILDENLIGA
jgi:hypothetical protein